jgi:hypothetical protein
MSKDTSNSSIASSNKRKRQEEDNQNKKAMFDSSPNDSLRTAKDKTHDSFIDYLNYNVNRSSMAEESLLLSPIPGDLSRRSINSVKMDMRSSNDADPLPKSITKRSRSFSGSGNWTGSPGDNSLPKSMNRMLDTSACISLGLGSSLDNTSQSDSDVDWNTVAKVPPGGNGRRSSASTLTTPIEDKVSFEEAELSYDDNSDKTEMSMEENETSNIQYSEKKELVQNHSEDEHGENDESEKPIQPLDSKTCDLSSPGDTKDELSKSNSTKGALVTFQSFLMSPPSSNQSNKSKTPGSGDKTVRFTPDTKKPPSTNEQDIDEQNINFSSPEKAQRTNSMDCSSNSLTPRLQALKAKLIRDTAIGNEILASSSKESYSNKKVSYDSLNDDINESPSPAFSVKDTTSPDAYKLDSRLSLTPFLKAAKERLSHIPRDDSICTSTTSPTEELSLISSNIEHSWGSFTPLSQEKSKRTFSIRTSFATIGEEDSYLDQSNDLSSAKKNLNAQSSALLLKVKGAAQKRMQLLAKSRDSLAAKENMQVTRNAMPADTEGNNAARRVELNGVQRMKIKENNASNSFKAKPMPNFSKTGNSGMSIVENPSVAKQNLPKLGHISSQVPQTIRNCDHSNEGTSFKAKALPRTNLKPSQLPKVEKRPATVAKSPILGSRRTDLEKPRSLRRPASVPRSFGSSNNNKLDSPVGLNFVGNVMTVDENIPQQAREPFVLHSTIRALKRSEFDKIRVNHELQQQRELKLERERMLKEKYRELDGLKDALR